MIPVLIAPALNRFDLLERMLRSIDVPVGRGLIIDNGRTGFQPAGVGPEWATFAPPFTSLGYPGSINFGITQTPDAPWWLWVSNDVHFGPGDLAAIAGLMQEAEELELPRLVSYHFAAGALNRHLVDKIGLFDEWAFWPLYYDDNDYAWRCHLAGVEIIPYAGGIQEGADGHETSLTIYSDPGLAAANAVSWAINKRAYRAKWGGLPGHEEHRTPWGRQIPLWATQPDLAGREERAWRPPVARIPNDASPDPDATE